MRNNFWNNRRVLVTGHTGFKGTWLTLWLSSLGAKVFGYSLDVPSNPNMYGIIRISQECTDLKGDINNFQQLLQYIKEIEPEVIFHMAAQSLVMKSYFDPIETFKTNVMGSVHVFEAARKTKSVKVIINVTSDKCYENNGRFTKPFHEDNRMGGHDPYSASKGCAELITESYRRSYFNTGNFPRIASVRAGNVIGGGDWGKGRLVPDIVAALYEDKTLSIRNRNAIRPWQHVLDPLNGYILLAEKLYESLSHSEGWNFGPINNQNITVDKLIGLIAQIWGKEVKINYNSSTNLYEQVYLSLDSSKAIQRLGWKSKLSQSESVRWTVEWYKNYKDGYDMRSFTLDQIKTFEELEGE